MDEETIETLTSRLGSQDASARASAAYLLGKRAGEIVSTKNHAAFSALLGALDDELPIVRANAAESLGKIGLPDAVPHLIGLLDDKDDLAMRKASEALSSMKAGAAVPKLLSILLSSTGVIPLERGYNAAVALREIGDSSCAQGLIIAAGNPDSQVRAHAAKALGGINAPNVQETLLSALRDQDWLVRLNAAQSLGVRGEQSAAPHLIGALKDEDTMVQATAVEALGRLRAPSALPHILPLIAEGEERIICKAADALCEIGPGSAEDLRSFIRAARNVKVRSGHERGLQWALQAIGRTYENWASQLGKTGHSKQGSIQPPPRFGGNASAGQMRGRAKNRV